MPTTIFLEKGKNHPKRHQHKDRITTPQSTQKRERKHHPLKPKQKNNLLNTIKEARKLKQRPKEPLTI